MDPVDAAVDIEPQIRTLDARPDFVREPREGLFVGPPRARDETGRARHRAQPSTAERRRVWRAQRSLEASSAPHARVLSLLNREHHVEAPKDRELLDLRDLPGRLG